MIRNKRLRKIEAKRLYLMGYPLPEIIQRIGASIVELEKWKSEEGWDMDREEVKKNIMHSKLKMQNHINSLIKDCHNPHVLAAAIRSMSGLTLNEIELFAEKIIKELKK